MRRRLLGYICYPSYPTLIYPVRRAPALGVVHELEFDPVEYSITCHRTGTVLDSGGNEQQGSSLSDAV